MRADRLVAALLLMQRKGRITAAELAAELEVSVATARRDLESLSAAGIPVYPQPGRGGGWALVGGARTDLTGLTAAEAQALFVLVGPSAAVVPEVKSALRKLVRALPGTFRDDAQAAAGAVVIDAAAWGAAPQRRPAAVDTLQRAVVRRRRVRFDYRGTARDVAPWGLIDKDDLWYLIAGTEQGRRTFRVDRMAELAVTDEPAERPADFDLAATWEQVSAEVEARRSGLSATVLIAPELVWVLQRQFGRHCSVSDDVRADGRAAVTVAARNPLDIAQVLAGYGDSAEVVQPAAVRAELARLGGELVARYG